MMRIGSFAAIGLIVFSLTACQEGGQKQTFGTILGGITGAVAGAQVGKGSGQLAAVAAGTLLGAFLGAEIGKSLDRADRVAMEQTTQNALEQSRSGSSLSWRNPDTGHHGTVTPQDVRETSSGRICRQYEQTVTIDGKTESANGTACRQNDGSWKVVGG
ncbi:MAG: RT0821/Lpp0805 family surface protein [Alphaproteobacteria bacterium]|jgi:surface antigen|nr:RT0821/Lpp0805 family surface protein [Alphaproteobacteria bacterium]MDP6814735.1 RT0821/Lpp0805 family surface protein [Alphaproteobacteria bacterium]